MTYKSLCVQQHSLSLSEGGLPSIFSVKFCHTNLFKSKTKTYQRKHAVPINSNTKPCHRT